MKTSSVAGMLLLAAVGLTTITLYLTSDSPVQGPELPTSEWLVKTVTSDQIDNYVKLVCNKFEDEEILDDCKLDLYMNWVRWGYKSTLLHESMITWHEREAGYKVDHSDHDHSDKKVEEEATAYRVLALMGEARSALGQVQTDSNSWTVLFLIISFAGAILLITTRSRARTESVLPTYNKGDYKTKKCIQLPDLSLTKLFRDILKVSKSLNRTRDIKAASKSLLKSLGVYNIVGIFASKMNRVKGMSARQKETQYKCRV